MPTLGPLGPLPPSPLRCRDSLRRLTNGKERQGLACTGLPDAPAGYLRIAGVSQLLQVSVGRHGVVGGRYIAHSCWMPSRGRTSCTSSRHGGGGAWQCRFHCTSAYASVKTVRPRLEHSSGSTNSGGTLPLGARAFFNTVRR